MGRTERIRQNIVDKLIAKESWWNGNILQADPPDNNSQSLMERHLSRQTHGKRRQVVYQLMDLTSKDLQEQK
jgi:hypothetical protein